MPETFLDRLQHAWSAFTSRDPTGVAANAGYWGYNRPDRHYSYFGGDQDIVTTVKTRITVDCAQVDIHHIKKDDNGNFEKILDSHLNYSLSVSANIDQTGRAFLYDLVYSMLDDGCVAAVPVETDLSPIDSGQFDITQLRVGQVIDWYPQHVRLNVYNENTGQKQQIILPKKAVAIIENPFYPVMNSPNSTLKRLRNTLRNLDLVNEENASGKMDLIVQLPYSLRSRSNQIQANTRLRQMERQLSSSKYGVAYIDAAERVTQLNRPVENNLWKEAQDLTTHLFNQLGLTQNVFDGTATESVMTNYYSRTIEPILTAIVEEMERKFLTKKARTMHQAIVYVRDPFKLVGVTDIAEMAKTFTSTEIMSSNEVRGKIGLPPSSDPRADQLLNKNINKVEEMQPRAEEPVTVNQNEDEEE